MTSRAGGPRTGAAARHRLRGGSGAPRVEVSWAGRASPPPPGGDAGSTGPEQRLAVALQGFGCQVLQRLQRPVEVSVLLCDEAAMRDLNARYRGIEAPTDVLSFGQFEALPGDPSGGHWPAPSAPVAGDVVIAVDVAGRQAALRGEPLERELCRLLVHGMLHLVGMDHADPPAEDEPMLTLQERMLAELRSDVERLRHVLPEVVLPVVVEE